MDAYTVNGTVRFEVDWRDESQPEAYIAYSQQEIDDMISEAKEGACG